MTPVRKRLLFWSVPLLALAGGIAFALWPRPVPVDLARVVRGPLSVTVAAEGETRVREVYRVSAPVAGEVQRLPVEAGDAVTAGETVVAALRPAFAGFLDARAQAEAEAAVRAAEAAEAQAGAELDRAKAEAAFAQGELSRIARLARDGTVSRRSLDRAQADAEAAGASLAVARAGLETQRHQLEVARARLMQPAAGDAPQTACCVEVRSPVTGRVLTVMQKSKAVVAAGTPLAEVGDPGALEIVADFLSSDAVGIAPGMAATIRDWGGAPLPAVVRRVDPAAFTKVSALGIDEQRVNVVLDFAPGQTVPPRLGHAFRVMVDVETWASPDTLTVPLGALIRDGETWAVFRVEDGTARRRAVQVGPMTTDTGQILGGVEAGDVVVLYPSDVIADGVSVRAR